MSKYDALGNFLLRQQSDEVPMSFAEIESITSVSLPPKAQHHRAWWSNNPSNNVMTKVWLEAGFRTEQVDIAGEKLVFRRTRPAAAPPAMQETGRTFEPALKTRHPIFGALKGTFTIEPGWDLTNPALDAAELQAMDAAIDATADLIDQGLRAR